MDILKKASSRFPSACQGFTATRCKSQEYGFIGNYDSWESAQQQSSGYDSSLILERTTAACLKVRSGEAAYERDSVIFDEIQYAWPLLAGLMWIAAVSKGRLNVLDFGGALGTTYYQNRQFLRGLSSLRWNIVEQPLYVERGRALFENDILRFYDSIQECLQQTSPQVMLLSAVLQYLKDPYGLLHEIFQHPFAFVLIDRTPFQDKPTDRLCVQRVRPDIFDASYPAWIFSITKFRSVLSHREIISEFTSFESGDRYGVEFKGFIISERTAIRSEKLR
jgi:putative methyltransferase (TIGR04325 family)